MLNIPSSVKALYQSDGVRKNFRVHFPNGEFADITNDNVVQESLHFTESLCSQSVFKFGLAEASVLEFETVGVGNIYGMVIDASIEIDCSSLSAADIAAIQADEGDGSLVLGEVSVSPTWESGEINYIGAEVANANYERTTFLRVIPNNAVEFSGNGGGTYTLARIAFYDADEVFIRENSYAASDSVIVSTTAPANAAYIRLSITKTATNRVITGVAGDWYSIPLGIFKVQSCPRNHGAMAHRQVTAYTYTEDNYQQFPNLPNTQLYPQIYISSEAFLANSQRQNLQFHDTKAFQADNFSGPEGLLYSSNKSARTIRIELYKNGTRLQQHLERWCLPYDYTPDVNAHWFPSYAEAVGADFDHEKYYNFGKRVAQALTDAGLDLTYNSQGEKVYDSNEAALLFNCPYYFYPCVYYGHRKDGFPYNDLGFAQELKLNQLMPILTTNHEQGAGFPSAFKTDSTDIYVQTAYIATLADLTGEDSVDYKIVLTNASVPAFTMDSGLPTSLPTINRYGLSNYGTMVPMVPEGTGEMQTLFGVNGNITHQTYNYSVVCQKMIEGILELRAQFLKANRDGTSEIVQLDNSAPMQLYPGDYSEMWWDEYDISPIGTVMVMS